MSELATSLLRVASVAKGLQPGELVRVLMRVRVQRDDVIDFEPARLAALTATVQVPFKDLAPHRLPPPAVKLAMVTAHVEPR